MNKLGPGRWVSFIRGTDTLNDTELEILTLLVDGKTVHEIARELFITLGSMKRHANSIFTKLEVSNVAEAVEKAEDLKLVREAS